MDVRVFQSVATFVGARFRSFAVAVGYVIWRVSVAVIRILSTPPPEIDPAPWQGLMKRQAPQRSMRSSVSAYEGIFFCPRVITWKMRPSSK